MATETRYEVIPAGYTPEDWAAYGPGIMARLRTELALAGFAKREPSDALAASSWREYAEKFEGDFVHTYKGEGLTACGLEVVGPCPDCATRRTGVSDGEFNRLIADIRATTRIVRIAGFVMWALAFLQVAAVVVWLVR